MKATEQHFLEALFIGYLFKPSSPNAGEPAYVTDGIVGKRVRTSGGTAKKVSLVTFSPLFSRVHLSFVARTFPNKTDSTECGLNCGENEI